MKVDVKKYWKSNLKILGSLLIVWFIVSFGFGILYVDELDKISIGGFKLGFWFAQQGSIYVFVIIILVYVILMNRLDRKHGVNEDD
ncbi:MAG TPA: DUF4212 domain-containing protein [Flavobacteriales bacterium]|nr:DUF4212 domain-containing protein [Flavobacteriales bacterium]HIN40605.1 DUF4212 domain-containing protein [Flavobacteriales bacterium]